MKSPKLPRRIKTGFTWKAKQITYFIVTIHSKSLATQSVISTTSGDLSISRSISSEGAIERTFNAKVFRSYEE
ncbi:MAG: hypothetical protein IPG21_03930 [Saprospiraceae bacterium]|nr:hypothetical protein [Candidatus Vicinibacter affinis]